MSLRRQRAKLGEYRQVLERLTKWKDTLARRASDQGFSSIRWRIRQARLRPGEVKNWNKKTSCKMPAPFMKGDGHLRAPLWKPAVRCQSARQERNTGKLGPAGQVFGPTVGEPPVDPILVRKLPGLRTHGEGISLAGRLQEIERLELINHLKRRYGHCQEIIAKGRDGRGPQLVEADRRAQRTPTL